MGHLDKVLEDSVYAAIADVPASFDARSNWPGLIHPIRDQQGCGSCWAFSASEVLGDRVAIASKTRSPVLSVEDMVSCDTGNGGCTVWHRTDGASVCWHASDPQERVGACGL